MPSCDTCARLPSPVKVSSRRSSFPSVRSSSERLHFPRRSRPFGLERYLPGSWPSSRPHRLASTHARVPKPPLRSVLRRSQPLDGFLRKLACRLVSSRSRVQDPSRSGASLSVQPPLLVAAIVAPLPLPPHRSSVARWPRIRRPGFEACSTRRRVADREAVSSAIARSPLRVPSLLQVLRLFAASGVKLSDLAALAFTPSIRSWCSLGMHPLSRFTPRSPPASSPAKSPAFSLESADLLELLGLLRFALSSSAGRGPAARLLDWSSTPTARRKWIDATVLRRAQPSSERFRKKLEAVKWPVHRL